MNLTLSAPPGRQHPPQPVRRPRVQRVGLVDRIALRVGVALVAWSRRPRAERYSREQLMLAHMQRLDNDQRKRAEELRRLLVASNLRT